MAFWEGREAGSRSPVMTLCLATTPRDANHRAVTQLNISITPDFKLQQTRDHLLLLLREIIGRATGVVLPARLI